MKPYDRNKTLEILPILKDLINTFSKPDYASMNIYSSQYYNTILCPLFSNPKNKYALIYGDFDGLNKINTDYGFDTGDNALYEALSAMFVTLPDNAIISRLGGDEFSIILPNRTKAQADICINLINKALKKISGNTHNLSITLASNSNESTEKTLSEAEAEAEAIVTEKKLKNHELILSNLSNKVPDNNQSHKESILTALFNPDIEINEQHNTSENNHEKKDLPIPDFITDETELKNWKIINYLISHSIENHISDIRPSSSHIYLSNPDFKREFNSIKTLLFDFLNSKNNNIELSENDNIEPVKSPDFSLTNSEITKKLHLALTNNNNDLFSNSSDNDLKTYENQMFSLLTTLIYNKNNNLFNKSYLNLFLIDKLKSSNANYQFSYFSMTGVRPSNTAFGHLCTDTRIENTSKLFINAFNKEHTHSKKPFNYTDTDSFLIDLGGGNFLSISTESKELSDKQLSNILESINSNYNEKDPNSSFMMSASSVNSVSKNLNLDEILTSLESKIADDKDFIKMRNLNSITYQTALKNNLKNVFEFYVQHIPNAYSDDTKKEAFLDNIMRSLHDYMANHNKETTGASTLCSPLLHPANKTTYSGNNIYR